MSGKYLLIVCIYGIPEWPLSTTYPSILVQKDFIGIPFYWYIYNIFLSFKTVILWNKWSYIHAINRVTYT